MQTEQLNLKLQKELFDEIEVISKALHIPKNEWARHVIAEEVKKQIDEKRQAIIREYSKENISREEMINIFGKKDVEDIDKILEYSKKSFESSKKLAKLIK